MKKLLTKLMGITLGLAMVVGAGAAIANNKEVTEVNAAETAGSTQTLTITRDSFSTSGGYAWYDWSQATTGGSSISGKAELYTTTTASMQFNKGKGKKVAAVFNTTALPGSITKIEATTASGTNRKWNAYVTSTACSINNSDALVFGNNKTTVGSNVTVNTSSTSIGTSNAGYSFFCLQENEASASYLSEIKITYVVPGNQNDPSLSLSTDSVSGFTGEAFSITATYANLTSDFAWGDPTGEGSISGSVTNTTGSGTDGTSTYSGTLTGHGAVSLTATGGGVDAKTVTFNIIQTTLNIVKSSTSIPQGEKETLAIEHNASSVDGVTWTSDNEKVSVSETGIVTVAADATIGSTATITAVSKVDANVSDTCAVTVTRLLKYTITGPAQEQGPGSQTALTLGLLNEWYPISGSAYVEWTAVAASNTYGTSSAALKFGTNTASAKGSVTLSIKENAPIYFTKVIVNAKTWSTETGNTLKVNNETAAVSADWDDYEFEIADDVTDIVLGNGNKRVNIYSIKVLYEFKTPEITVNNASYEIYTNETASAEVTLANFLETPTLESNVTGDTASISSVAIGAIANNKATVTITPNKVAGTAVVRIRDAANPDTYYVDIQVTVKSVEELIEAKVSRSSLYYKYSKDGNDQFHFSSIKLRLGGFISEALWTDLNAESEIQGFGAILAKADNLSEDIKTFVDTFDNANVRNVYHPLTEKMPADADEYQKTEQGVNVDDNYYVWSLTTIISDEDVNNLTEHYTCVAYIKTSSGVVFMQETTKSVADVARDVVQSNEELYNDEYLEGSLRYLASL